MPFLRFSIDTALSRDDASAQIRAITRQSRGFLESIENAFDRTNESDAAFIGKVDTGSFRIRRDIRYRNSFLPMIHGQIIETVRGTQVRGVMIMHPLVIVFMIFWLSGVGFGAWKMLTSPKPGAMVIPAVMLIFGAGLMAGGFFPEALKARRLLQEALGETSPSKTPTLKTP